MKPGRSNFSSRPEPAIKAETAAEASTTTMHRTNRNDRAEPLPPRSPVGRVSTVAAFVCISAASPLRAEYRLTPGDVVEVAVAGVPDLRQRVPIQPDGSISLPSLGKLKVGGLPSSELQALVQSAVSSRPFRLRLADGREQIIVIQPGDVAATVAEYRPIYVSGDVLTPGQHPYRPMMTVRQAVAISGGYSLLRSRMLNPYVDPAELKRDHDSLWAAFAKERIHAARLKAELNDKDEFDKRAPENVPLPASTIAEIVQVESESLRISQADARRDIGFLQQAIRQADNQIDVLSQQLQEEERGVRSDQEELQRTIKLYGAGSLPSPRVTENRRAVLLSSTRQLQTTVSLMQVKRQREDLARQLDRTTTQRRVALLRDMGETTAKIADLAIKMQAAADKMRMLTPTDFSRPNMMIIRKREKDWERILADGNVELEPGDTVEVSFRSEFVTSRNEGQ